MGLKRNINVIPDEIRSLNPDTFAFDDTVQVKVLVRQLLGIIEQMAQIIQELQDENQKLRDEIHRLKREKGRPHFKTNIAVYDEIVPPGFREKTRRWKKASKKTQIKIDRVEKILVDRDALPKDAVFKGYRSVIVQNIKFETDNVEYRLERYYSPGGKRTIEAKVPANVDGEFGPDLKAYVISQNFSCQA